MKSVNQKDAELLEIVHLSHNYVYYLPGWSQARKIHYINDVIIPESDKQQRQGIPRTKEDIYASLFSVFYKSNPEKEGKPGEAWELLFALKEGADLERRCLEESSRTGKSDADVRAGHVKEFDAIREECAQEIADVCYKLVAYDLHLLPKLYNIAGLLMFAPDPNEVHNQVLDFCIVKYNTRVAYDDKKPELEQKRFHAYLDLINYGDMNLSAAYMKMSDFMDELVILPGMENAVPDSQLELGLGDAPDDPQHSS
jgi:hypothetical protein